MIGCQDPPQPWCSSCSSTHPPAEHRQVHQKMLCGQNKDDLVKPWMLRCRGGGGIVLSVFSVAL